ncbi:MAG: ShlB/FhaC/HecB family hemolysin secretion/activation protein [Ancalomicrobiaceae bacterium]|nr:ShlB/FhaC/HecB family hemolysin secretion/activation protein [Ancalomicrobiaceae bacterium]
MAAASLMLCLGVSGALAQTASQITPASVRPPAPANPREVAIPELSGPEAPKGADRLKVRLAGVALEAPAGDVADADAGVATARAAFKAALVDRTVTVADIFKAARGLEAAYGRAGYVLTRVIVPAQKLKDGGRLRIVVIGGFVERIETKDLPSLVKSRIEAVLAPVVGRRSITLAEIERALVLAGDTPGVLMKSTLAAGKQPGGSVLIIEARHKLVTGSFSIDNTVGASLGGVTPTLALQLNSALGAGEQIYAQIGGDPFSTGTNNYFSPRPTNRQVSAGVVIPLGIDGWSANFEAIRTDSAPNPAAGQQFYSEFERLSARLKYALVRSRAFNISNEAAFDIEQERLSSIAPVAAPISLDRLRVLRDTAEISGVTLWGGFLSGRIIASLGIDGLGARDAASATPLLPLSRQGADASFQKVEISGHYGQLLTDHLGFDLFARAQTSFGKPLLRAEQIGLVGGNGISGFDAGTFQGDSGLVGRAELSSPWTVDATTGAASVNPYAFGDVGSVWLMRPTSVERRQTTAGTLGLGLRIGAAPSPPGSQNQNYFSGILDQASLSLEWGHQYRADGIRAGDRFTISSAIQF